MSLTVDPKDPCIKESRPDGQQECYLVLSQEERAKGFVRPLRTSYIHKGEFIGLNKPRSLTEEEKKNWEQYGYVAFVEGEDGAGWCLKPSDLDSLYNGYIRGCGTLTKMNNEIAETYARNPKFYGATFCVHCGKHFPVSEFVWDGSDKKVGS